MNTRRKVPDRDKERVEQYCAAHNMEVPSGSSSLPRFTRSHYGYQPQPLEYEEEKRRLWEALDACIWLSDALKKANKASFGFRPDWQETKTIPLLTWEAEGQCRSNTWNLPEIPALPEIEGYNEIQAEKVRRMKKTSGTWLADIMFIPTGVKEAGKEGPVFRVSSACLMKGEGEYDEVSKMCTEIEDREKILLDKMINFFQEKGRPKKIIAISERAYLTFASFGRKTGIPVVLKEDPLDEQVRALRQQEISFYSNVRHGWEVPGITDNEELQRQTADFFGEMLLECLLDYCLEDLVGGILGNIFGDGPEEELSDDWMDDIWDEDSEIEEAALEMILDFINKKKNYSDVPDSLLEAFVGIATAYEERVTPLSMQRLRKEAKKRNLL